MQLLHCIRSVKHIFGSCGPDRSSLLTAMLSAGQMHALNVAFVSGVGRFGVNGEK